MGGWLEAVFFLLGKQVPPDPQASLWQSGNQSPGQKTNMQGEVCTALEVSWRES